MVRRCVLMDNQKLEYRLQNIEEKLAELKQREQPNQSKCVDIKIEIKCDYEELRKHLVCYLQKLTFDLR